MVRLDQWSPACMPFRQQANQYRHPPHCRGPVASRLCRQGLLPAQTRRRRLWRNSGKVLETSAVPNGVQSLARRLCAQTAARDVRVQTNSGWVQALLIPARAIIETPNSAVHREGTESGQCPSDYVRRVALDPPTGGGPTAIRDGHTCGCANSKILGTLFYF